MSREFWRKYEPGITKSKEYNTWHKMRSRCKNPKDKIFRYYGARGISVCQKWEKSFLVFLNDMGKAPTEKHSIDRINVNGNYTPSNCRWALPIVQANNTRFNIFIEYKGSTRTLKQWSRVLNFHYKRAHKRLLAGWKFEEIIKNNPARKLKSNCLRGHKLSGSNLYIKPNGNRICRKCKAFHASR